MSFIKHFVTITRHRHEVIKNCFKAEGENSVHFAGGATAQNGDIYALPVHADNILHLSFEEATDEMKLGNIDAIFINTSAPVPAVMSMGTYIDFEILNFSFLSISKANLWKVYTDIL